LFPFGKEKLNGAYTVSQIFKAGRALKTGPGLLSFGGVSKERGALGRVSTRDNVSFVSIKRETPFAC